MKSQTSFSRREFITRSAGAIAALSIAPISPFKPFALSAHPTSTKLQQFSLAPLPYDYNALEPTIDEMTMQIHHGKHHAGYIRKLNASLAEWADVSKWDSLESIFANLDKVPEHLFSSIRNNGGGTWNHSLFWESMTPNKGTQPSMKLQAAIDQDLGGMQNLQKSFSSAAATRFGSGWSWLNIDNDGQLFVSSTPNQDNPMMQSLVEKPGIPILGIDVWEHAYYLHYQNRRSDYISAFWSLINWEKVSERYEQTLVS